MFLISNYASLGPADERNNRLPLKRTRNAKRKWQVVPNRPSITTVARIITLNTSKASNEFSLRRSIIIPGRLYALLPFGVIIPRKGQDYRALLCTVAIAINPSAVPCLIRICLQYSTSYYLVLTQYKLVRIPDLLEVTSCSFRVSGTRSTASDSLSGK